MNTTINAVMIDKKGKKVVDVNDKMLFDAEMWHKM